MITENLSTLKIHKLTQAQYDRELAAGNLDPNAIYLTPDEEIDLTPYATIEQLDTKADAEHVHDDVYYTESEIDSKIAAMQSDIDSKVDAVDGMGLSSNDYTTSEKDKLATVEANANFYEHPNHASHASGLYKVAVDEFGHVSSATLAAKEDIVALGIPAQDTTYDAEISGLSGRIDDVENSINTTNATLSGVSQELENYKTTNNEAVAANATNIETNKTAIKAIQDDYLTSADRTQLQDNITQVSNKATANASAIEVLNGDGIGSVKQSIDNAFNEFAANVTNDDVVNTYKELIDYAATHSAEFVELVGEVDTIKTDVSEIETDLSSYKTTVSDQFTEANTTIDNHVTNTNNPHGVTKEQIGLEYVDNTSDLEKPISNATQEALDGKADSQHNHEVAEVNGLQGLVDGLQANFDSHTSNNENPHAVTAEQVGTYNKDEIDTKLSLAGDVKILDSADNVSGIIDVPTLSVKRVDGGTSIIATDNNGVTTSMVRDGMSTTHSWNGTTLTVTSASGTSSSDLKGEKGDQGIQGIQGIQGETGAPATLVSAVVTYQVGTSGKIAPTGEWSTDIPDVPQGQYLWTRKVTQFNSGDPITEYSVAYMGVNGDRYVYAATLSTNWIGSSAPYTQDVAITGILESDTPHIVPVYSEDANIALNQKEAWAMVSRAVAGADKTTFTCLEDKPAVEVTIQVEVIR